MLILTCLLLFHVRTVLPARRSFCHYGKLAGYWQNGTWTLSSQECKLRPLMHGGCVGAGQPDQSSDQPPSIILFIGGGGDRELLSSIRAHTKAAIKHESDKLIVVSQMCTGPPSCGTCTPSTTIWAQFDSPLGAATKEAFNAGALASRWSGMVAFLGLAKSNPDLVVLSSDGHSEFKALGGKGSNNEEGFVREWTGTVLDQARSIEAAFPRSVLAWHTSFAPVTPLHPTDKMSQQQLEHHNRFHAFITKVGKDRILAIAARIADIPAL